MWAGDEARLGLQPILRRVWAKQAARPSAVVEPKYEWLWLYAAVHPQSGTVFWLILPKLDAECVEIFLREFAKEHVSQDKQLVLVWDRAPAHRATKLKVPEGITICWLPAYTPELNPTERLWSKVKEAVANKRHETLDELEERVVERCVKMSEKAERIRTLTWYYWWDFD